MHFEKIEEYSFDHGFHFNPNTGEYHSLNPHDLGRPLTHTEMDYNLLYQKQTLNGWRIAGSNADLTLNSTDLNKVLAYKQITQSDSEWSRYNAAGLFAGQLVWVPVEIGTVAPTTTTTTLPPTTTTTTTTQAPTTTSTTTTSTTTTLAPQYISLTAAPQPSVDEGTQIQFNLTTQNVLDGTTVGWTITGVDGNDISGGLTGTFTINSNAVLYLISVSEDLVTEGTETLTLTLNTVDSAGTTAGLSASIDINDTSLTPTTTSTTTTQAPTTTTTTQAPTTTTTTQAPTTTTSTTTTSTSTTTTTLPEFDCGTPGLSLSLVDGPAGSTAAATGTYWPSGTVGDGTSFPVQVNSTTPNIYQEGLTTYMVNFTIGIGFSNSGQNIECPVDAIGTTTTTTSTTTSTTTTQAPTTTTTTSTTTTTLPEFTCSAANVVINDGAVGDSVTAQVDEGTVSGITPSTYQLGSTSYTVAIIIPSGYNNAGGVLDCIINATGTTTTSTTTSTTTTTTTSTTTTTQAPTTTTTTTLAPLSTGFYFHLGNGGYPYTQDLINGTWYKQNNSVAVDFADGFADALANTSSYETISLITTPLVDGSQWTYPTSVAQNFYWLLIPDSWNIPDLTATSKLADTQNNIPDVASAKLATTVYGEPYTLYKINLLSTTQGVTIKYVD